MLLPLVFLTGCKEDPKEPLPEPSAGSYTVKLTADNSTLTSTATTEAIRVELPSVEDPNVKYTFEITSPAKLNTKSSVANQIELQPGAVIKSISEYTVEKITVDYFGKKGQNYQVFNNVNHSGDPLETHESSIAPTDPDDGGKVVEFAINSTGWSIYNHTEFNKPTFYYISVSFKK